MKRRVRPLKGFPGVYEVAAENDRWVLATKNLTPGRKVYGESIISWQGEEYRVWNPYRSKLAAAINKGLKELPIKPGKRVLYLGAASGTTVSHVSDIVDLKGCVYCVEFAPRPMRELIESVAVFRENVFPILEDARFPKRYKNLVGAVDVIYCDIAQPEQAKVLVDNASLYLKEDGGFMIAVKAMSIDVTKDPEETFKNEALVLRKGGFEIRETVPLEPYDKAHVMITGNQRLPP